VCVGGGNMCVHTYVRSWHVCVCVCVTVCAIRVCMHMFGTHVAMIRTKSPFYDLVHISRLYTTSRNNCTMMSISQFEPWLYRTNSITRRYITISNMFNYCISWTSNDTFSHVHVHVQLIKAQSIGVRSHILLPYRLQTAIRDQLWHMNGRQDISPPCRQFVWSDDMTLSLLNAYDVMLSAASGRMLPFLTFTEE
jgi:hypothetical protein